MNLKAFHKTTFARYFTLLVIALMSASNVWGETIDLTESLNLTTKTAGTASYNTTTTYGDWKIVNGANNNKGWEYFKMGGKNTTISSANPCYIYYSANSGVSKKVDKIKVHIASGSLSKSGMSVNSWGVYVYSDKDMTTQIDYVAGGTITKDAADFEFTPSSGKTWSAGCYYKVSWDLANTTSTNGIVCVDKITLQSIDDTPSKTLTSIAISDTPTKMTYDAGEEFDPTGLTVTGTYDDESTAEITSGITWTVTPSPLIVGTTSVSVTATVGEITSEAYQVNGLTVNAFVQTYANTYTSDVSLSSVITGSKVKWEGCKVTDGYAALKINKGGTAKFTVPAGTKTVHLHMVAWNGESADVAVKLGETTLPPIKPTADAGVSGTSTTYPIATEPKTENSYYFAIEVNAEEATTLSLTTASSKRAILFGVNFEEDNAPSITATPTSIIFDKKELDGTVADSKTISVTGKNLTGAISSSMKEGSSSVFSVTPNDTPTATAGEFTVSYSTTEIGEYSGTVVLSSGETSLEIPVSVSVVGHIPVLQSIYVNGAPTKKEYTIGDAFETAGLEVWGKYDEGDDQQITEGIEWEVTPATFSATTEKSVSVVAKALEKTSEAFDVTGLTVNEAPKTIDNWNTLFGTTYDGSINQLKGTNDLVLQGTTDFGVTVKVENHASKSGYVKDQDLRFYTNEDGAYTFTVTAPTGKVFKQIVATKGGKAIAVKEKDDKGVISIDATSGSMTWTGKANSLIFIPTATTGFGTMSFVIEEAAPSAATPTITPSTEAETYWEPTTVTLATTTEDAAIYYTTDGTTPTSESTLYSEPFEVSATTTVKAIAIKEGLDDSEVASKAFTFGAIFNSLEDLVAANLTSGTTVKVSFENVAIKSFYTNKSNLRQGIYFDVQKDEKDIEIYYSAYEVPETWVAGGTVSGTMTCPWTIFNETWELAPAKDTWNWTELTYTAPKQEGVTKVEVKGTATHTEYVEGERFDPAGLTVFATINSEEQDVTEFATWIITPETLTTGITSVNVKATYSEVTDESGVNVDVTVLPIEVSTIADFISNQGGRCYLIGEVSGLSGKNFTLTDASGSIYVYGHNLDSDVDAIKNGDYIKVIASEYEYYQSKTHEAKNVLVVSHEEKPVIAVESVSLDITVVPDLMVGKSVTLVATVLPENAENKNVSWSSSDEDVATVENGVVTAVAEGEATITVTTEDGEKTAKCKVSVIPFQASWDDIVASTVTLSKEGGTSASDAIVVVGEKSYPAIKAGTGSAAGAVVVTVPAGTSKMHVHLGGWSSKDVTVTVKNSVNSKEQVFDLKEDAGITGNSPFELYNAPSDNCYEIDLTPENPVKSNGLRKTAEGGDIKVTFTATKGNRFVLYGASADVYTREVTIPEGEGFAYGTICLPSYGAVSGNVQFFTIHHKSDVNVTVEGYPTPSYITLEEVEPDNLVSGTPYIFKATEKFSVTLPNENIALEPVNTLEKGLVGTFDGIEVLEKGNHIIYSNLLYVVNTDNVEVSPFRAYIDLTKVPTESQVSSPTSGVKMFNFFNNEADGIININGFNVNDNVNVNLNGQPVGAGYKGIVIMNGKKVLRK
ncbi:MAG: chitobiase/beta-hexosaminidase C-terminal domain-containing protein [Bacteroidaceae bacterium]|nr:chitobiase/beta-hexosaminidase C-terminal domain-containing protein [Bacteroidaceae bacterium]